MAKTLKDLLSGKEMATPEVIGEFIESRFSKYYLSVIHIIPKDMPDIILRTFYQQGMLDMMKEVGEIISSPQTNGGNK